MTSNRQIRQIILLIFVLFISLSNLLGQDTLISKKKESDFSSTYQFMPKVEYIYQHNNYVSVGLGYLNPSILDGGPCNSFILGTRGFSINSDIKLSTGNDFNIIPKLSYEFSLMLIAAKLNLGYGTDFKQSTIVFSPEVGLTGFGLFYIFYGYNWTDKNILNISGHKLTVGFNLSKLWLEM